MLLLLPIGTDAPQKTRPTVNYIIIGLNIVYFLVLNLMPNSAGAGAQELLQLRNRLVLYPAEPETYQFITYQFLHADWMHLLGNMWFLWVFGNAVNSKMGHVPYLFFYLAGGIFAALGFALIMPDAPMVGASGAIAAITTAYLVLYPRSEVRMLYWIFFFIGTFEVGSILLIIGKMIFWDNLLAMQLAGDGMERSVAYQAHLAGYLFGFLAALLMLGLGALPRDAFDIIALWSRWRRRTQFASLSAQQEARRMAIARPARGRDGREPAETEPVVPVPQGPAEELRVRISRAIDEFQLPEGARLYRELLAIDPEQVLGRTQQLDIANQLTAEGDYDLAAQAYEKYLARYPNGLTAQHVQFLLGVIYARHLKRYDKAQQYLEACRQSMADPNMSQQCDYWLQVARGQAGPQGA